MLICGIIRYAGAHSKTIIFTDTLGRNLLYAEGIVDRVKPAHIGFHAIAWINSDRYVEDLCLIDDKAFINIKSRMDVVLDNQIVFTSDGIERQVIQNYQKQERGDECG